MRSYKNMSIVSVDNIQPIGSGTTVTVNKSVTLESGNTNITGVCTATSFEGAIQATTGTFSDNLNIVDAIRHSGDADTKIRFPSADTISFENGGTERLRITSTGKVGIGTNNPSQLLSLSSTSPRILLTHATSPASNCFIDYAASGVLELSIDDNDVSSNSKLQVRIDGAAAPKLTIDANGDVSITDGNLIVASGHGIDFSATGNSSGTMSSELLDDYEEGSWTPNPSGGGTINGTSITYSGHYTKVGRVVHLEFFANNSAGDIEIPSYKQFSGLPFATASGKYGTGRIMTEDGEQLDRQGDIIVGGSTFLINKCGSSSGSVRIGGTVTYIAT